MSRTQTRDDNGRFEPINDGCDGCDGFGTWRYEIVTVLTSDITHRIKTTRQRGYCCPDCKGELEEQIERNNEKHVAFSVSEKALTNDE